MADPASAAEREQALSEAARHLLRRNGLWPERHPGLFIAVVAAGLIGGLVFGMSRDIRVALEFGIVLGPLLTLAAWFVVQGQSRMRNRIVRERLCFNCGYSLLGRPRTDTGCGRCPECGRPFSIEEYADTRSPTRTPV